MKTFSSIYDTFNEWLVNNITDTPYKRRIIRYHGLYPDATLSQLRGHARKKEKPLSKKQELSMSKRSWASLNPKEKLLRRKSLEGLSEARRNKKSLTKASKEKGITLKTVLQHTNAFKKIGNRWMPKSHDRISRVMKINENGKTISIEIKDSRIASIIGSYNSAVGKYRDTGDISELLKFEGKTVKDAQGNIHVFETDTDALDRILESKEDEEFYDIYS